MIGDILITLALVAGVFTVVMYYLTYKGYENTKNYARIGYHFMAVMVVAASALLLYAVLTHQYQYKYVFNYSGSGLPVGLLISTFYAGQEGSFLLWLLFTTIVGLILMDYTSKRGDLEERVMMVFTFAAVGLLTMISPLLKSPFEYIWVEDNFINIKYINAQLLNSPFIQNFFFQDPGSGESFVRLGKELYAVLSTNGIAINNFLIQGKGLNPLLQNFWMQIHPPLLFVGFSMAAVPFSFAIAALIKNEYKDWVKQSLPWLLSATMLLGLAIMLGGYWAYGVLGWGGYWGWDPVENSSLVPWIIGVAAIHTMIVQKKYQDKGSEGRFVKTNLILSVLMYVTVLYSTFLTRSGILSDASVHSFVAPGQIVFLALLTFLMFFLSIGVGGVAYRWKYLTNKYNFEENLLSRELALFTGSVALIASAIIVLVGTSAPIFGTAVEIRFYNELNLPIAIIIAFLNGFSLLLKWKQSDGKNLVKDLQFSGAAAAVSTILVVLIGGVTDVMLAVFVLTTAFSLFVNLEIMFHVIKGRKSHLGAYISHAGLAVFFLGVIATGGYSQHGQVELIKGQKAEIFGHQLTFTGYVPIENGAKYAFNVEIADGESKSVAAPVMYIAEFNNSLMREPDILNGLFKDFYVAPLGYSDGKESSSDGGREVSLGKGESIDYNGFTITFESFNFPPDAMQAMMGGGEFSIGAVLSIDKDGKKIQAEPKLVKQGESQKYVSAEIPEADLKVDMKSMDAGGNVILILTSISDPASAEMNKMPKEVLTVEASIKPFINLVWAGVLIMVAGFIVSASRRTKESQS